MFGDSLSIPMFFLSYLYLLEMMGGFFSHFLYEITLSIVFFHISGFSFLVFSILICVCFCFCFFYVFVIDLL